MTKPKETQVRGGTSGRSFAPRKTVYKGKDAPKMWQEFMAECKRFRTDHGMSTNDVAQLMGVSVGVVSLLERGVSQPHPWDFTVYLEAIGVTKITLE